MKKILLLLMFLLPNVSFAQVTDNFDSYTDGDLNGQGSWSGNTAWDIQGTTVQGGTKAITHVGGTASNVSKSMTSTAAGVQSFYFRVAGTADALMRFFLVESETNNVLVKSNGGALYYFNGASYINWASISSNIWYKVDIQWDKATQKARYRLDNGTWTSYDNLYTNTVTGVNTVILGKGTNDTTAIYFDTLTNATESAATTPIISPLIFFGFIELYKLHLYKPHFV